MAVDPFVSVLRHFGSRFDPEVLRSTSAHWQPRVTLQPGVHVQSVDDVSYGEHPRHRLDLFPVHSGGAPIVLFVHGGGFVAGDKRLVPPFYANVGRYFAAHGIVGACMNYRLAPDGGWPAAAEDIEQAISWLLARGDLYGGDPARLVVIGQSAGACHVATWLLDARFDGGARQRVLGAVLMSGFYLAQAPLTPGQVAYFGDDEALHPGRSPLNMVRPLKHPVLVTIAEHDPVQLREQGAQLSASLSAAGTSVTFVDMGSHNHVSPLMSMGSDRDDAGGVLRRFIGEVTEVEQCTNR